MTENRAAHACTSNRLCQNCGATALNLGNGKCNKCGSPAALDEYGFKIARMRDGSYLLTDIDSNPIDTILNLSSDLAKQKVAKLTSAPYVVVAKAFAKLKLQQDVADQEKAEKTVQETEKAKPAFDAETEEKVNYPRLPPRASID